MSDDVRLLIVGDGPVADALMPMVAALGWAGTATTDLAEATEALDRTDAVVVTSHHDGLDAPTIRAALAARTPYVGAMGSRRTQARRREWLLAHEVSEEALAGLHAPIGLDIGADAPGEIAVSILAEIVAVRRHADAAVTSISDRDGAIHPDQQPGEAYCPGG